ncbi:ABC-type transport system involved in multi-copper enzyme maturation permease subunit [Caldanaerobacter subterraneus subsp. tengcongensis MB4]|uniref:ABC-type transport system involved in multi-copper enzyme maturation, permease component n=1 Tax=Caldanaerobacter subterraneus subsp. tengcongensis (strain DSM 15242 / JCM 11007 / NBRC 100824 / MB4) TaxID=273068 RepID=Q8R7K2_CALS4|nr:ABC transporter permease [Caldanaerobacter subterraneus]AAM25541.1 ABC-type transport system involved in multi-copper enzyme maturation, permease component [Caldanaerobacter subterraneus subsp. tengcongensis MB4]MCS3917591.1 ABC-type transport system involved in multi-copper enzyme maturation permease subunit [Caldanaerobacter subterraneus subsp. tengcongensis MB4]
MITIIKYTFKEMLKKRAFLLVFILSLLYLSIYAFGLSRIFERPSDSIYDIIFQSEILSAGLFFANLIVAFLVVLTSVNAISGEIESGTIYSILSKPIKRYELVLGKFIGLSIMIVLYSSIMFLSVVGLNIWFGSKISFGWDNILKGLFFFDLGPIVFLALIIASSSIFSTINTGIIAIMAYGIALVGGVLEQIGTAIQQSQVGAFGLKSGESLINAGIITSLILPTDVIYRKMTAELLTQSSGISFMMTQGLFGGMSQPSIYMFIYIFFYVVFLLYYGAKRFSQRDL